MKLNLTDDEKDVELPQNEHGIPILMGCTACAFIINFLLSGNPFYALGASVGSLIIPGIIALVALYFTRKWSHVFGVTWLVLFLMAVLGQLTGK